MSIKETILPLADALRWATYHHIDSNPSEVDEARAALCAALDAADLELEEANQVVANFEVAIKKADAENAALRSAMTTLLANPTSKLMQNIARAALEVPHETNT